MESSAVISALAALAQETRLAVFRLLVTAGPTGMSAGDIAAATDTSAPTMSHHLGLLERAGLLRAARAGRSIRYAADYDGTRQLIEFLTEDCCAGRPELCGAALAANAC